MKINPRPRKFFNKIAYCDEGRGVPVVLIHGFSSNIDFNWNYTGWFETLLKAGFRVIAIDNRGHGQSEKFYESSAYTLELMAADVKALTDHLGLDKFNIMGFSMGARITSFVCALYPESILKAVISGMGHRMIEGVGNGENIAQALEAASMEDVADPKTRMFRIFAEQTKSDLKAIVACVRGSRARLTTAQIAALTMPILVVVGTADDVAGDGQMLADLLPNATYVGLEGKNHMNSVGDKEFKAAVTPFFQD